VHLGRVQHVDDAEERADLDLRQRLLGGLARGGGVQRFADFV